jgi:biotin carboxylase
MKTMLLLGAGVSSPDAVARMKSLGVRVILVELPERADLRKAAAADEVIITDYRKESFIALASQLRKAWPFDAVVSITEAGVAVAARLNALFGFRGSSETSVARLNDKARMRAQLAEAGFSRLTSAVLRTRSEALDFGNVAGYPFIMKPIDGGGSHGIHRVATAVDAGAAFDSLLDEGLTPLGEEYVDGKEYSVESFSFEGEHHIVAITEKVVNERFVEIGHVVPAMLDPAVAGEVRRFVTEFLTLIAVTNGPCHTEIKAGSKGLKIIESHNRPGGGNISRLVLEVYGVDLIKLTGQWACRLIDEPPPIQAARGAAATHFFLFPAGEIVSLEGLDEARSDPATLEVRCLYNKGDIVPPLVDNSGRSGYVIVRAADTAHAIRTASRLARAVVAVTA